MRVGCPLNMDIYFIEHFIYLFKALLYFMVELIPINKKYPQLSRKVQSYSFIRSSICNYSEALSPWKKRSPQHIFHANFTKFFRRDILRNTFQKQSYRGVCKQSVLKNFVNSRESTHARVSSLFELQASAYNFIKKETLTQMFSYKFRKTFKNTFFIQQLPRLFLTCEQLLLIFITKYFKYFLVYTDVSQIEKVI